MRAVAMDDKNEGRDVNNGFTDTDMESPPITGTNGTAHSEERRSLWRSILFPWLLVQSLFHLAIYINKLSQDAVAVGTYYEKKHLFFCAISVISLLIPSCVYVLYLVADALTSKKSSGSEICTRIINGMLIIPWQIKGHVEVLHFAAQRVCKWQVPTKEEDRHVSTLKREAFVLEFFEDFYAGFIQLLLQIYILIFFIGEANSSLALVGEIVGSALCFYSFIQAIQRKDDGPLTGLLSFLGWTSIAASRVLCLSLLTSVVHGWISLICLGHAVLFTIWISSIVFETYKTMDKILPETTQRSPCLTVTLIFVLFGLPSLTYWPIMFEFKKKLRVFVFLLVLVVENATCVVVWFLYKSNEGIVTKQQLLIAAIAITGAGVFFISLYICCKPEKTDLVVLHHMREADNENKYDANKYGIYFDFCKAIMILPETEDIARDLMKLQKHLIRN